MRILDRYLGTTVAASTLIVMMVFMGLFFFLDFVDQLRDVGKGNYGLWQAIQFVVFSQPRHIYELFPIVALLGSLIGLGWLASNSELIVIRAAGVSLLQISLAVMKIGGVLVLAAALIGEFVVPISEQHAHSIRSIALQSRVSLITSRGFWTRDGQSFINIRAILPGQQLRKISIYEFDDQHRLRVNTFAKDAHFQDGKWLLEDIVQSYIADDKVTTRHMSRATWGSLLNPDLVNIVAIAPEQLSAVELNTYIDYLRENNQNSKRYQLAYWTKLVWPFLTAVMVFLAIPFVFGSLRSVGMGQRILVGSLLGITFYLFNQIFNKVSLVYGFNPIVSVLLPTLLFLGLSIVLMRRVH